MINQQITGGGVTIKGLTDTNITISGGDSGAPYISLDGTKLYGSHSTTGGLFSPIDRAISDLLISPVLG